MKRLSGGALQMRAEEVHIRNGDKMGMYILQVLFAWLAKGSIVQIVQIVHVVEIVQIV
jgi:hypothetical protein